MRDDSPPAAPSSAAAAQARETRRDIRLDFFRGLGMFIILTAHIGPYNPWVRWIPARFGFSDATEIFVFCSGAASAIAFLKVFETRGWWIGTGRISYRIWQIYWCHIGLFFAIAAALVWVDGAFELSRSYLGVLNLARFFDAPEAMLLGLVTLSYVPNYFDILVMYIVILALIPVVAGLSLAPGRPALAAILVLWAIAYPLALTPETAASSDLAAGLLIAGTVGVGLYRQLADTPRAGAFVFVIGLWLLASQPWIAVVDMPVFQGLSLPAEVVGRPRSWFFNPFAWQLIFFTGFAFAVGWLPAPPVDRRLIGAAAALVVISIPVNFWWLLREVELFREIRGVLNPLAGKSFFGVLRYAHFLALAYLVWVWAGNGGRNLPSAGIGGRIVTVVRRVGQQSLAVFVVSMVLGRLIGVWLSETARPDETGAVTILDDLNVAAANLAGYALLVAVAYIARYYRNPPWKKA